MSIKATITKGDYLNLRGLAVVAAEHSKALAAITKAAAGITGEEAEVGVSTYYGCTSGEFYSEATPNIDGLLSRLGITVEDAPAPDRVRDEAARLAHVVLAFDAAPMADKPTYRGELIEAARNVAEAVTEAVAAGA